MSLDESAFSVTCVAIWCSLAIRSAQNPYLLLPVCDYRFWQGTSKFVSSDLPGGPRANCEDAAPKSLLNVWRRAMLRNFALCALALLFAFAARAQATPQALSVPPDSPRWDLQGQAKLAEYQGRKCLLIDGGAALLKDFEMRDGVIDVDVATPASRGFFGFMFRIVDDGATAEEVYLRQHKSGAPDAMQYTPVLHTGRNWQIYNGPGFTGAVDIPKNVWFHLRLEVTGAQAKLYVKDLNKPALVMNDLKSGVQKGQV